METEQDIEVNVEVPEILTEFVFSERYAAWLAALLGAESNQENLKMTSLILRFAAKLAAAVYEELYVDDKLVDANNLLIETAMDIEKIIHH